MAINKTTTAIGALVLGILLAGAGVHAWAGNRSLVTFSGAVALPGVTLGAGQYVFEIENPKSEANVVTVRTAHHAYYMGFANQVPRPEGLADSQSVILGEAPRGVPPRVLAWYPEGRAEGFQFIYANR